MWKILGQSKRRLQKPYKKLLAEQNELQERFNFVRERNIRILKSQIIQYGIEEVANKFIPQFENNWKWLMKEGTLPENGGRKELDKRMRLMNTVRNCLLSSYNDRKHMTPEQIIDRRIQNFTPKVWANIEIIEKILG